MEFQKEDNWLYMVAHNRNSTTRNIEVGELGVQSHHYLHNEFKAILEHIKPRFQRRGKRRKYKRRKDGYFVVYTSVVNSSIGHTLLVCGIDVLIDLPFLALFSSLFKSSVITIM